MSPSPAMAAATAFQDSFVGRDFSAAAQTLAPDVAFRSPVLAKPWCGKEVLQRLGPVMVEVLCDPVFAAPMADGDRALLMFTARHEGLEVEGVLALDVNAEGDVSDMAILLRPLTALAAVAQAMARRVDPELLAGHAS